ncbi:hypothetical protein ACFW0H_12180 [Pseudomonas sp. CR3202]|uniref:COG4315 family predicted lipoprotein n=1 Tax=Pseudomonas sp. CR3202 TaxID=3351532 RepID=UPI003BF0FA85
MLKKLLSPAAALTLCGLSSLALAADPAKAVDTALGKTLADSQGMTLYTFAKDSEGKSACNGPCAQNWPPLMAPASAEPGNGYTVITRDDGSQQWAYQGKPLYTWIKDAKPGDTTGDGVNQVWQVAKP